MIRPDGTIALPLRTFRMEFPRGTYDTALASYEAAKQWAEDTGQNTHPQLRGTISRPDHPQCPSQCRIAPAHLLQDQQWRIYVVLFAFSANAVEMARSLPIPAGCRFTEIGMS
jgi:hypothetical protein